MKVRGGFVSNSSSSSFICIGVSHDAIIKKLLEAEHLKKDKNGYYEDEGFGQLCGKVVTFYGSTGTGFNYVGLDEDKTKKLLETHSIKEARTIFKKLIEDNLGLSINESMIDLYFGETSSD